MKEALDIYDEMPKAMKRYISHFGWNFNKAACMMAVGQLRKDEGGKRVRVQMTEKAQVDELLARHGVELKHGNLYNHVYLYNWLKAKLIGTTIQDEKQIVGTIKAVIDDAENEGGNLFRHWYWDNVANGRGVDFNELMDD